MESLLSGDPFVVLAVVTALVAVAVVGFKVSEKVEAWREECFHKAQEMRAEGLSFYADLLERTAFRDKTGQIAVIARAIRTFRDPDKKREHVDNFLRVQLEKACSTTDRERLNRFASIVAQYSPAVAAINTAAAVLVPPVAPVVVPVAAAAVAASSAAKTVA